MSSTARTPHRLRPTPAALSLRVQVALVGAAWLLYFGIRALTEGSRASAIAHAHDVLRFEQRFGMDWEDDLQGLVENHRWLLDLCNWVYIWGHWPVIAGTAVWLFLRHQDAFRRLRNAMFASGGIGLFIFALVPVAPPRLAGFGLTDTVTAYSHSYRALQPPGLTNIYAAMPSLHFGWDLLVGITIVLEARRPLARAAGVLMPILMGFAVVATANHFVIDVVAGGTLALVGLAFAIRLQAGPREADLEAPHRAEVRQGTGPRRWSHHSFGR